MNDEPEIIWELLSANILSLAGCPENNENNTPRWYDGIVFSHSPFTTSDIDIDYDDSISGYSSNADTEIFEFVNPEDDKMDIVDDNDNDSDETTVVMGFDDIHYDFINEDL